MRTGMLGLAAAITVVATAVAPVCEAARSQRAVQSIIVDGAKVQGNRIAVLHAPAQSMTFVKTLEYPANRYHFDICIVDYKGLEGDLTSIAAHLNSPEAMCRRINDTTFAENDNATKVALKQAMNTEIIKQMTIISNQMKNFDSTVGMGVGPGVGTLSFMGFNSLIKSMGKSATYATNAAMLISSSLQITSYFITDMALEKYHRSIPLPVEQQPGLKQEEPGVVFKIEMPPGVSSKSAIQAFERAFNDATVEVDDNLHILQGVPLS